MHSHKDRSLLIIRVVVCPQRGTGASVNSPAPDRRDVSDAAALPVPVENERVQRVYDRLAGVYARTVARMEAPSKRRALSVLDLRPGERVLSAGCGPGLTLPHLVARVGADGAVVALDAAPGMLAEARRHCRSHGVAPRVSFVRGDLRRLPLADGSLDAVFAADVLELFDDLDLGPVCAELFRVLAPGGRCCVVTMDVADVPDSPFLQAYEWAYQQLPGFALVGCRPIDARARLERAGFEIERVERDARPAGWLVTTFLARKPAETGGR